MAEQSSTNIGRDAPGAPGESMRGVTGREPIFAMDAGHGADDTDGLFALPVDSEHKARKINLFSVKQPHMRAFHLAWFSFFTAFCSSFAAPPLVPIIRENINLTKTNVGAASITSVVGAIFSRIVVGSVCDLVGPRYGAAFLLMTTVPCTLSMAAVSTAEGYITVRLFIGFALATFVTCQYWMSSMFNAKIVGLANGVTAGWGNLGGGFIQLVMPYLLKLIEEGFGVNQFAAWRLAFFVPGVTQMVVGFMVLSLGQDSPDGQYLDLNRSGVRKMDKFSSVLANAMFNYRTYIMILLYGYCFGVELTVDNVIHNYFVDHFGVDLEKAGLIAASFGMANIISRPSGGILSDIFARRFGMRGRLFFYWTVQSLGGLFCLTLGYMTTLPSAIIVLVIFSYFCQAACGAAFGIVPFISRRSLGIVSGLTGAGGNFGSGVTQAVFFTYASFPTQDGFKYMGITIMAVTLLVKLLYFPQWGSMYFPPSKAPSATEEAYYASEYNTKEQDENMHSASMKFAENSKGERGRAGVIALTEGDVEASKKVSDF